MSGNGRIFSGFLRVFLLTATLSGLAACDNTDPQAAAKGVPLDARLSEIYGRTCVGCHTTPDSGAPQSHNVAAWANRLNQGDDILLAHMADGFGGMPPLGQCAECSADDLVALMHFMAGPAPASAD